MLTGSFASAYYGAPRATQDIDFVIVATADQLRAFIGFLPKDEFYADLPAAWDALERGSLFNVIDMAAGWKIDCLIRKRRPFSEEEFRRRIPVQLEGVSLFIATAEDVILSKLEWAKLAQSRRQIEDVAGILRVRWDALDHVYLEKWLRQLGLADEWKDARYDAGLA